MLDAYCLGKTYADIVLNLGTHILTLHIIGHCIELYTHDDIVLHL